MSAGKFRHSSLMTRCAVKDRRRSAWGILRSAVPSNSAIPFALLCYGGDHETRFAMTSKTWISRLGAPLIAFVLTVAPSVSPVHAVDDARKVSVVSFGLFGDQGVFRSEATGAAQVVAGRFGSGPSNVQYNSKKGGKWAATGQTDAIDSNRK